MVTPGPRQLAGQRGAVVERDSVRLVRPCHVAVGVDSVNFVAGSDCAVSFLRLTMCSLFAAMPLAPGCVSWDANSVTEDSVGWHVGQIAHLTISRPLQGPLRTVVSRSRHCVRRVSDG